MPCPFADNQPKPPVSVVHDFADLPILLADDDDKKRPVGNPIVPGSELPTEDFDENARHEFRDDEQRRRDANPVEKPNL